MARKRSFTALTPEQQQLAAEYEWTARTLACRWYYRTGRVGDVEDYISEAYTALVFAAAHFDASRGYCFNTLLGVALRRRLWILRQRLGQKARRRARCFSEVERDDMPPIDPPDHKSYRPARAAATADLLAKVKKHLSPQQWELLQARFLEGETLPTLGERLGLTKQAVLYRIDTALQRARRLVLV
jgi:RNA polymerase sigma factor (sigma-70 family)